MGLIREYWVGRLSALDILIKVACFVKWYIVFKYKNEINETTQYKEVKCTDPSPSLRFPWLNIHKISLWQKKVY